MEKRAITGDNRPRPVGSPWTTRCTACGSPLCPQSVEIVCPPIHSRLSWSDGRSPGCAVDRIGTTSRSPACGREKVTESVDGSRNPGPESNTGARGRGADGGRVAVGGRGRALMTGRRGWVGADDGPGTAGRGLWRPRPRWKAGRGGDCAGRSGTAAAAGEAEAGLWRVPEGRTSCAGCREARDGCGGRAGEARYGLRRVPERHGVGEAPARGVAVPRGRPAQGPAARHA